MLCLLGNIAYCGNFLLPVKFANLMRTLFSINNHILSGEINGHHNSVTSDGR